MANVQYFTLDANFESCSTLQAKIAKIDAIIDSLLSTALKSVATGNIAEYKIDTGQSVQTVVYASTESVTKAIKAYETIRTMYVNKITGYGFKQVDGNNVRGGFH